MTTMNGTGAAPSIPRVQTGSNPQHVLATLVADYTFAAAGAVGSAAIIRVLGEFGVSAAGARSALSRVVRRGLLVPSRDRRHISYAVNEVDLSDRYVRLRRYVAFGATHEPWNGGWTLVIFSIPDDRRALRPRLRAGLEKLKFAPLTDAVWVRGYDHRAEAARLGAELGVDLAVIDARFHEGARDGLNPIAAFDLESIRALYSDFLERFSPLVSRLDTGDVTPSQALVIRTSILSKWRHIADTDPALPPEVLPNDWPQAAAREVFARLWHSLGPLALGRLREIVGEDHPDVAERLDYYRADADPVA